MAIITISRELAALGDETAHELAKIFGYRFVDKQELEHRMTSHGLAGIKLDKYDERKPTFWASLFQDRDDYLHFLKIALYAEAEEGNCVFIGRGANAVFKDLPAMLSVRLVAPLLIRIERVKSYFRCDDKRARQIIEQSDHDRDGFHRYFFDMNWSDSDKYHLTINTGIIHPAAAAKLIMNLTAMMITVEAESLARTKIKELTLAQYVVHHVLYDRKIPIHFLEVRVSDGSIYLHGVANSQSSVEAAVAAAREISAGKLVLSEIQVVQEYSVMP